MATRSTATSRPCTSVVSVPPVPGPPWCGVTYKAFLDFVLKRGLNYLTVDTDYGCGIITKAEGILGPQALPPAHLAWFP